MKVWNQAGKLIRFRIGYFIGTFISTLLWLLGRFGISFGVQEIIDTLIGEDTFFSLDIKTLFIIIPFTFLATFLFGSLLDILFWLFYISGQVLLRRNIMRGLLRKPGAQALPDTSGEAISRFRGDVDNAVRLSYTLSIRFGFVVYTGITLSYMFYISWKATSLIFVPFMLILAVGLTARRRIDKLRKKRRRATAEVTDTLGKIFGSIQTFKVTCKEENILNYFDTKCQTRKKAIVKEMVFIAIIDSIYLFSISLGMGTILLLIGPAMNIGTFTVGNLYFFQTQLWWIGDFLWMLGDMIPVYQQAKVSYERMLKLIQNQEETVNAEEIVESGPIYEWIDYPPYQPILRSEKDKIALLSAKNLSFSYPGTDKGISDIDIEIPRGSVTVVTGRIGSGKTTLLRAILGLVQKDQGDITWNGELVTDPDQFMIPPRAAYTPQIPYLFSDSLKNNIMLNILEETADIDKAVELAVFEREVNGFVENYDTIVGPKGVRLSGGQKQRLAAARMFIRKPELLVFDDLSSALDVETEHKLWERMFSSGAEITCLAVSHRPMALKRADIVIVLKNGKIDAQGRLQDLLRTNEEMQKLWEGDLEDNNSEEK
ncbi:MAG: ABC transporter ATP-binding protein [Candidatus Heimdallarchaeota archaeon]